MTIDQNSYIASGARERLTFRLTLYFLSHNSKNLKKMKKKNTKTSENNNKSTSMDKVIKLVGIESVFLMQV